MTLTRMEAWPATAIDRHDLRRTLDRAFGARVLSHACIGDGAFGVVHDVTIDRPPHRAIVKVQKFRGWAARERRQLEALRRLLPVAVAEVYHEQLATDDAPCDALVLERLPGVDGRALGDPARLDERARATVRTAVVDLLLTIQSVRNERGYGDLDGPFQGRWWDAFAPRVRAAHAFLHRTNRGQDDLDSVVIATADRSLRLAERIVGDRRGAATLVHGDVCLGNILVDPLTLRVTGLIDPLDAGWGDPVLDTVHLTKSGGHHFGFVQAYVGATAADERFWLRYWFYQFWSWLSYYERIGLAAHDWYLTCARRLAREIETWFPVGSTGDDPDGAT